MGDPTNVVGRRIGAYVIDAIVVGVLSFALLYPLFMSASETAPSGTVQCAESDFGDQDSFGTSTETQIDSSYCFDLGDEVRYVPDEDSGSFTAQVYGISIGLQALNFIVLQGTTGASLGKLLLGLRVIRQDGKRAGLGWAALRWLLLFVDAFCCILPGLILVFTTKGHRRIGDMAAGTLVVRKEAVGTPPVVPGLTAPEGYAPQGYGNQGYGNQGYGGQGYGGPTAGGWAPPAASSAPSGDGPTWDAARNAYIQYDQGEAAWKQWDDATSSWKPIDQ